MIMENIIIQLAGNMKIYTIQLETSFVAKDKNEAFETIKQLSIVNREAKIYEAQLISLKQNGYIDINGEHQPITLFTLEDRI